MLLQDRGAGQGRPAAGWLMGVGCGLVALAVLAGGARFQARAAADEAVARAAEEEKKADPKKEEPKKKRPKKAVPGLEGLKDLDELLKGFAGAGLDEDQLKELRKRMEEAQKRMAEVQKQMEQLRKDLPRGQGLGGGWALPGLGQRGASVGPRLGVQISVPSKTLVEQLDLPKDQGIVLEEVGPNSAAAKAGLKKHDVLLELNGKPVPSTAEGLRKLLDGIKPDTAVDAVVLRKGKKETIKGLKLPEAKAAAAPAPPNFPNPPRPPRLPALPGGPNVKSDSISITRTNDRFVTEQRKDGVTIKVTGKVADGKAEVSEVRVDDGKGQAKTYDSLDKVPEAHREQAKKLAEMSAAGRVRFTQP